MTSALRPLLALALLCALAPRGLDAEEFQRVKTEFEIDPYYTSVGLYTNLTQKPIPNLGEKTEWEIYRELASKFYLPRTLVIEASINPLPLFGTVVRSQRPEFYQSMNVNRNLNLVQAVTAGFEEPWAASFFLGNVVAFQSARSPYSGKRHGYTGFLVDAGNFHIKDNVMVPDPWVQTEWKFKGEQFLKQRTLLWSARFGAKFHQNQDIANSFYVAFRRSRTDFGGGKNWLLHNSGIEYIFDMAQRDLEGIRHYFLVNKKLPLPSLRMALSLSAGFVWTADKKYSGTLADASDPDRGRFQILFQPNLEF